MNTPTDHGLLVVRSVADLRRAVAGYRKAGRTIGLVPTMGALHEGHLSLVRLAGRRADRVVASLFVNPTQFAPHEDFEAYPRDEARDAQLLADAGCALLYAPTAAEMYAPDASTTVTVAGVSEPLDGAARPGHFAGVATVVAKLLVKGALARGDVPVTSIFVNPTQFGPKEDFSAYPRDEEGDFAKLREAGCRIVFAPTKEEMYPGEQLTTVTVAGITDGLNRLFSNSFAPLVLARRLGFRAVHRAGPLKGLFMRHAMGLVGELPRLSRSEPL